MVKPEILVGDFDGNFYIYEYSGMGNTYNQTWLNRTPYLGGSNFIVSGNFLGNGKKQFVVMAHADLNADLVTVIMLLLFGLPNAGKRLATIATKKFGRNCFSTIVPSLSLKALFKAATSTAMELMNFAS